MLIACGWVMPEAMGGMEVEMDTLSLRIALWLWYWLSLLLLHAAGSD